MRGSRHRTGSLRSPLRGDWVTSEPVPDICQVRVAPAFLAIFAACSGAPPTPTEPAWASVVASPLARQASIDVTPGELGEDAVADRMRHRVRLKRIGRAWLGVDASPMTDRTRGDEDELVDQLLPVIGETAGRIRVAIEEDSARVAVWIDRRDAWESIVAPVRLEPGGSGIAEAAAGAAAPGVWLEAGAPIYVIGGPARARRIIELRDQAVAVQGTVPAALVGHVWIVPRGDRTKTDLTGERCSGPSWRPPPDPRLQLSVAEGTALRGAASEAAVVLATVSQRLAVAVLARRDGWTLVELPRPYARLRGYVPSLALDPTDDPEPGWGTCGHGGFGMSHADRIEVPAGTCMFDRAGGEVVGVAAAAKVRFGARARGGDDWSMVYVQTRWARASLYVHDTARDPAHPVLESCAPGRHRR